MMTLPTNKIARGLVAVSLGAVLIYTNVALAQGDASAPTTAASKQAKKAQRKAARAKKDAELKTLEKNGYSPAADDNSYPQNLQKAEAKAAAQKQ